MAKVIKANNTSRLMHIGGVTIPPFESREVDERDLPGYRASKPAAQAADPLAEAVDKILSQAAGQIGEMLPALSDDELSAVAAAEEAKGKPRKTVVQALEAERIRRAAVEHEDGGEADQG